MKKHTIVDSVLVCTLSTPRVTGKRRLARSPHMLCKMQVPGLC